MRTHVVTVGGRDYNLPVNFAALDALARSGIDPAKVIREKGMTLRDACETVGCGLRLCGEKGDNDALVIGKVTPREMGELAVGWCLQLVMAFNVEEPKDPKVVRTKRPK